MKYCETCGKRYDPDHGGCDCEPDAEEMKKTTYFKNEELRDLMTEDQQEKVYQAMDKVRMAKSCWWYELAKLVLERDEARSRAWEPSPPDDIVTSKEAIKWHKENPQPNTLSHE